MLEITQGWAAIRRLDNQGGEYVDMETYSSVHLLAATKIAEKDERNPDVARNHPVVRLAHVQVVEIPD